MRARVTVTVDETVARERPLPALLDTSVVILARAVGGVTRKV